MQSVSHSPHGFTLIELMIVITIIGILFFGAYVPYDYYSRLSKVRISTEKIRQSMEDAKILAQNGQLFPGTVQNADIGLLIKKDSNTIDMFAYLSGSRSFEESANAKIIKTISLEDGVFITTLLTPDKRLIEYSAPNGNMEVYTSPTATGSNFEIGIGWKTTTTGALYKIIPIEK